MQSFNLHIHITHIQDIHNIAGPLVPYNHVRPKRGLIHQDRENSVIRQLLYLQAPSHQGWIRGIPLNYYKQITLSILFIKCTHIILSSTEWLRGYQPEASLARILIFNLVIQFSSICLFSLKFPQMMYISNSIDDSGYHLVRK